MPAPTMGAICAESSGDLKPGPRREETLPPSHLRRIGSPPVIIAQEVQEAVYRQQGDLRARGVPNGAGLYAGAIHGDHYVAEVRPSRAIQGRGSRMPDPTPAQGSAGTVRWKGQDIGGPVDTEKSPVEPADRSIGDQDERDFRGGGAPLPSQHMPGDPAQPMDGDPRPAYAHCHIHPH